MAHDIGFRLGEMLATELRSFHGRVQPLAVANTPSGNGRKRANSKNTVDRFDYRKLKRFLDDPDNDKFQFSISELRALDRYFSLKQQSLCTVPIFYRKTSVLDSLAEISSVAFAVATRFESATRTETVSRWDLRAMEQLLNKGAFEHARTRVLDIFHRGSDYAAIERDRWNDEFDERITSMVSFGSPFACHATERILAEIFGVQPFQSPALDQTKKLPLYFLWPGLKNRQNVRHSSFLLKRSDIAKLYDKESALVKNPPLSSRGIIIGDRWYPSDRIGNSYGLLVAQRQTKDCIYAAIVGAFGPNTLAVAKSLADGEITTPLPPYDRRGAQQVLTAIVQARTEERSQDIPERENRVVPTPPALVDTALWKQDEAGLWQR